MSPAFCPEIYDKGREMPRLQDHGLNTFPTNLDFSTVIIRELLNNDLTLPNIIALRDIISMFRS